MVPARLGRLEQLPAPVGRVFVARSLRERLLGLALIADLPDDCALLIPRCASIHTFGMRFALDVTFLGADGRELRCVRGVGRGRVLRHSGAAAVLERRSRDQAEPTSALSR